MCVTGAISCLNMPAYLEALRSNRPDVSTTVILSKSATRMISPTALSLFAQEVIGPSDDDLQWNRTNHVRLGSEAALVVIAPATASRLSRLARGDGDDLIGLIALSHPRPLLIFPSMNRAMWGNVAVVRNRDTLVSDGHVVSRHEARCLEVLSGARELAPAMPPPQDWAALLTAHIDERTDRRPHDHADR